jgi:GAF domain-containing protein
MPQLPTDLSQEEKLRWEVLKKLQLLDSDPEVLFDDIVLLASIMCDVPTALVSLLDVERQWFKARIGLEASETPRDAAFCAHTVLTPNNLMIVEDATKDPRFEKNPLVTGAPHIRFYAGAPLVIDGAAIGSVCVIDYVPREISHAQQEALRVLARQTAALLRFRALSLQKAAYNQTSSAQGFEGTVNSARKTA